MVKCISIRLVDDWNVYCTKKFKYNFHSKSTIHTLEKNGRVQQWTNMPIICVLVKLVLTWPVVMRASSNWKIFLKFSVRHAASIPFPQIMRALWTRSSLTNAIVCHHQFGEWKRDSTMPKEVNIKFSSNYYSSIYLGLRNSFGMQ